MINFREVLKEQGVKLGVYVYYMVKTDDYPRPKEIKTDKSFDLDDVINLNKYVATCELHDLEYWVEIEYFNYEEDNIETSITIIDKR